MIFMCVNTCMNDIYREIALEFALISPHAAAADIKLAISGGCSPLKATPGRGSPPKADLFLRYQIEV